MLLFRKILPRLSPFKKLDRNNHYNNSKTAEATASNTERKKKKDDQEVKMNLPHVYYLLNIKS